MAILTSAKVGALSDIYESWMAELVCRDSASQGKADG